MFIIKSSIHRINSSRSAKGHCRLERCEQHHREKDVSCPPNVKTTGESEFHPPTPKKKTEGANKRWRAFQIEHLLLLVL